MRINKYVALATGLSRRAADASIEEGRVRVNGHLATKGQEVHDHQIVTLDNTPLRLTQPTQTIMLNKPTGYVVSREGQGSKTIYALLASQLHHLKPVGRLDKASSGLLLLTNDGALAHELTHPRHQKTKVYEVELNKPLQATHQSAITTPGVMLGDGLSKLVLLQLTTDNRTWKVEMQEGRNRQIRRTFAALGYDVVHLHRIQFGPYRLQDLKSGTYRVVTL